MIIESADVYTVIKAGMPYAVATLLMYLAAYLVSYALLFKVISLQMWKAFVPFYGQAVLFKKYSKSPWLVLLPFIPIIGLFYFFERLTLRMRIASKLKVFWLLRPLVWFLPTLSNIALFIYWRWKNTHFHKECELGEDKA